MSYFKIISYLNNGEVWVTKRNTTEEVEEVISCIHACLSSQQQHSYKVEIVNV